MPRTPYLARALACCLLAALATGTACARRDVAVEEPTTKILFQNFVPQPAIDKVDVLVAVDNSGSMADKQKILAGALPDLVRGLLQPKCIDKTTRKANGVLADPLKPDGAQCPAGSEPAFTPIADMHIGVITSSLGGMGGDQCQPDPKRHHDDHGRLVARSADGGSVAAAGDLHFLAWYPDVESNTDKDRHPDPPVPKTKDVDSLVASFRDLVVGVGQDGCGLEAQLESLYHFIAMPDPWTSIDVSSGVAKYQGVDGELLKQRAAFLRPDSLVAVIVLTDEDDSSVDPLSYQGTGFKLESETQDMPRGTPICATNAASPECKPSGDFYSKAESNLNVRFSRMKQRFGVDPQYPIQRYVDAFTKPRIPGAAREHDANGNYAATNNCVNPLFAKNLPVNEGDELCLLPRGPRSADLVYFALIGGVSGKLLPSGDAPIDWTSILGRDATKWDEAGLDPHMRPSIDPRPELPGPTAANDADPLVGRDWTTKGEDLEYACIFDLYDQKPDGTAVKVSRSCDDPTQCDCNGKKDSPLCDPAKPDQQIKGKAYPTRRELMVAKGIGDRAIVSSLCPAQLTDSSKDDWGYRPAVRAITDRLSRQLVGSCLPRPLQTESDGSVSCIAMAVLPDDKVSCQLYGLETPTGPQVDGVREKLAEQDGEASRGLPICNLPQIAVPAGESCRDMTDKGPAFCYTQGDPAAGCQYAASFTKPTARLANARFVVACIANSQVTETIRP